MRLPHEEEREDAGVKQRQETDYLPEYGNIRKAPHLAD
jgi:hypothetical protein